MDLNSHSLLAVIALILTTLYTSNFWNFFLTLLGFAFRFLAIYALLFLARPELEHFVARMEQKSEELLAVLKNSNLSLDVKVAHLLGVKSDIKQKNVPEGAVPPLFECLRLALASPHIALITAGFSTLGHFLKRLFIQELHSLVSVFAKELISCLLDRLGDHKDRVRGLAAQALTDMWPAAAPQIDRAVFEVGLTSKNARLRHSSLNLLSSIVTQYHIGFRQYVPDAVACLEDADKDVRKAAKTVIVDLFKGAAPHAQADLQRQMADLNVRKTIVNDILIAIGLEPELPSRPPSTRPPSVRPPSRGDAIRRPPSRGDVLHRPPSRGDALHSSASRGNAVQRPASRVDTSHSYPVSSNTHPATFVTEPASVDNNTDPVFHHPAHAAPAATAASNPAVLTRPEHAFSAHPEQTVEALTEHASVIHRPVPTRPNTTAPDAYKAPRAANAPVDRRAVPATPRRVHPELDTTVQPRDISSAREMEQIVRDMLPCFNGKEDETNWQKREKNIIMLRRITHGNAPHEFSQAYLAGIKTLLDPIFKVANSLRTTMQTNGLEMLQSLARVNGSRLDPMIDIILNNAMKLCGNSKKITAHNGNLTVGALLENVTCNTRVLAHVTSAAASSNNNLRFFSAGWLRIVINGQGKHKTTPEGLASIAQCINNGISDARPENRESYRLTFWEFHKAWPSKAQQILNEIAPKHRATIEKDAANPMNDPFVSSSTTTTTGLFSSTPGRPTAAKGAIAAKARPNIAPTATFAPPTEAAQPAQANRPRKKPRSAVTATPTSSLTSAPMRPGASKPRQPQLEINPRPATAAGFHPTQQESPTRGSPARIPVAYPPTPGTRPIGVSRPRQKSDPLQNASPTKMGVRITNDPTHTPDRPFGRISIPKKRTNSSGEENGERKNDENAVPKKVVMDHGSPRVDYVADSLEISGWPHHEVKEVSSKEYKDQKMLEVEAQTASEAEPESKPELPGQMPADADDELHDIQTIYPNAAVDASQLQVEGEGSRHEPALSPEISPVRAIPPVALPVAPEALDSDHNGEEKAKNDTVEEAISARASANSGVRRTSAILPLLPSWPKADNTPGLQPGDTPPLQLEKELTDTQHATASDSGKPSGDETPDVQVSRALRPFSDRPRESEATPTKRDITLRSQDPVQAREMLAKGISRIQTRDMDMNGYRKLQGLIEFHHTIFTDAKQFDTMLEALLAELVTQKPPSDKVLPFGSVWDFKTQVLYTVKSMFINSKTYFSCHYPGTVIQLLEAQKPHEIARYLVKVIDQLIDDIVDVSEPPAIVDALMQYLPNVKDDPQHKILRKGFETIGHALVVMNEQKRKLPEDTLEHIGELATDSLQLQSMGVRRRIIAMCVELRVMVHDEDRYWKILGGADKGVHGLLFYYKSKHRVD